LVFRVRKLIDHDNRELLQAFLYCPAPLGFGARGESLTSGQTIGEP
jgi:hypothetical protein